MALVGALLIIRPGLGVFQPAALLPLAGAFTYAAGALLTRVVRTDSVATSVLWSAVVAFVVYKLVDLVIGLRVPEEEEREGLDITSHGESAYHS